MAVTNSSDYNLATTGLAGEFIVDSSNPWYSTPLNATAITDVSASGDQITYTLGGTPDLSEVKEGDKLIIKGLEDNANNGIKVIVSVNDGADTITVDNEGVDGVTDASPRANAKASVVARKSVCLFVESDLTVTTVAKENSFGAAPSTLSYSAGNYYYGDFTELVVSGGVGVIYFDPDERDPELT